MGRSGAGAAVGVLLAAALARSDSTSSCPSTGVPRQPAAVRQLDWTETLVDPLQRSAARRRHPGEVEHLSAEDVRLFNEKAEMDAIGGVGRPGVLMDQGGDARRGTTVTVHGISDNPASVLVLGEGAARSGEGLATFAWDDRARRLGDSADDLARSVWRVLSERGSAPVTVNAYSMGGRVAIVALGRLEAKGVLAGRAVHLNLVAPPLQGFEGANAVMVLAPFVTSLRSIQDMGTRSAFQTELEGVRFRSVRVRVLGGGEDRVAVPNAAWIRIARRLSGEEPHLLPGVDHDGAVEAAARTLP